MSLGFCWREERSFRLTWLKYLLKIFRSRIPNISEYCVRVLVMTIILFPKYFEYFAKRISNTVFYQIRITQTSNIVITLLFNRMYYVNSHQCVFEKVEILFFDYLSNVEYSNTIIDKWFSIFTTAIFMFFFIHF